MASKLDVELRLPLGRWLEGTNSMTQLRQAVRALADSKARSGMEAAAHEALALVLPPAPPNPLAATTCADEAMPDTRQPSSSDAAAASLLSTAGRTGLARFVDESVERLQQLADLLLSDRLADAEDRMETMRAHVHTLLQHASREQLQILFDLFCSKTALQAAAAATSTAATPAAVVAAAVPSDQRRPRAIGPPQRSNLMTPPQPSAATPASSAVPAASPSVDTAPSATRVAAADDASAGAVPSIFPAAPSTLLTPSASAVRAITAVATPPVAPAVPVSATEAFVASPSAAAAAALPLSSPPRPPSTAMHFLQSSVASNTDVLCLLLSFVGCTELLSSCSRVCARWFAASLDPRCFRQIRQFRLTHFIEPDAASSSSAAAGAAEQDIWNWQPAAAAAAHPLWPTPSPSDYASMTRVLAKLSNLRRLELGPRTPDAVLRALGNACAGGYNNNIASGSSTTSTFGFLRELRELSLAGNAVVTDAGVQALVANCRAAAAVGGSFVSASVAAASSSSSSSSCCILHGLESLELRGCRLLTDVGFGLLFGHAHRLVKVDLSLCSGARAPTLASLARHCPSVTRLDLAGARGVNDEALRALAGPTISVSTATPASASPIGLLSPIASGSSVGLAQLQHLNLEDCWNVSSTGLLHLTKCCRHLQSLNLSGCYNAVQEQAIGALVRPGGGCVTTLTSLNFTGCPLTDAMMATLAQGPPAPGGRSGGLRALRSLCVSQLGRMGPSAAELSDVGIAALCSGARLSSSSLCRSVTELDLSACALMSDHAVQLLASSCPSLTSLLLARCVALSDAALLSIAQGCFAPVLRALDVSHVYQLTGACMLPLRQGCPKLQQLVARSCLRIGDQAWTMLQPGQSSVIGADLSPSVLTLDLSACAVTDRGMRRLAQSWRHTLLQQRRSSGGDGASGAQSLPLSIANGRSIALTSLSLSDCRDLRDEGLAALLPRLPSLTSLSLAGCAQLTPASLDLLSRCPCAPRLRSLVLHQLVELTDVSLAALFSHTPLLTEVGLDELGPALTDAVLDSLASHCPSLTSVSLARAGGGVTHPALLRLLRTCSHIRLLNCSLARHVTALQSNWPDANWQQLLRIVGRRGVQLLR